MESLTSTIKSKPGNTITQEIQLALPSHTILEGFTEISAVSDGIDLRVLAADDALSFHTHNSYYRVVLLDPKQCRVSIQGGTMFASPTEVIVRGSTQGGSMLKTGWVSVGFQLELSYFVVPGHLQNVITSPVERLSFDQFGEELSR